MREIKHDKEVEIVYLFLNKLELLNDKERSTIIATIDWLNNPIFITHNQALTPIITRYKEELLELEKGV